VDHGIVVPLMKWHSWLGILLDIYTQIRSLSQLTYTHTHSHNYDTFGSISIHSDSTLIQHSVYCALQATC